MPPDAVHNETPVLRSPEDLLPADAPDDLHRIVAYWIARAGDRPMPSFGEIDPIDIPWALSRLYIVRVVDGGADYVYRLVGETIKERHGMSLTGRRPRDLFPAETTRHILERWHRIVNEPAVCYTETEHPTNAGWRMRARRVQLPLGPVGGPPDNLFNMTIFEEPQLLPGEASASGVLGIRWVSLVSTVP